MQDIKLSYQDLVYLITALNVVLGILFGSLPLIAGLILKNRKYAWFGFLSSIVGGAVLGVFLSFPFAAIFTWLIARNSKPAGAASVGGDSQ